MTMMMRMTMRMRLRRKRQSLLAQQQPWRERAEQYLTNPKQVHWIVEMGTERARTVARQTMKDVREAMGLNY